MVRNIIGDNSTNSHSDCNDNCYDNDNHYHSDSSVSSIDTYDHKNDDNVLKMIITVIMLTTGRSNVSKIIHCCQKKKKKSATLRNHARNTFAWLYLLQNFTFKSIHHKAKYRLYTCTEQENLLPRKDLLFIDF